MIDNEKSVATRALADVDAICKAHFHRESECAGECDIGCPFMRDYGSVRSEE